MIRYSGTVRGFRREALPELRRAAMRGLRLDKPEDRRRIQRGLRRAQLMDLREQILRGGMGGDAA
ncbi:MAG: hypothetical protein QME79_14380 [Bacillota bacterium]|nr:hypothetical protein [Bacillota bacterium]